MTQSLDGSAPRPDEPAPAAVLQSVRERLHDAAVDAEATLRLAEAIRVLAVRHGPPAVGHCLRLVESLRQLLDEMSGETRS
jgi:two-component system nitrogen regulation response regulator NtrX